MGMHERASSIRMRVGPNGPLKFRVRIGEGSSFSEQLLSKTFDAFSMTFEKVSEVFFRSTIEEWCNPGTYVVSICSGTQVVAGCRLKKLSNSGATLYFENLFATMPGLRLGRCVLSSAFEAMSASIGEPVGGRACCRVLPDDSINPAIRVFTDLGFSASRILRLKIDGTHRDRHLMASARPDGTFEALEIEASPASFQACARAVSQRWRLQ